MGHSKPAGLGRTTNPEIAQQWIDYLQKKNAILNLVWSVMLVVILILSVASFFFYHQYQTYLESDQARISELTDMTQQRDHWRTKSMKFEAESVSLAQEVELLETVKNSLEQQKGEASELLAENQSLAANMKLQLTQLEKDNLETSRSLLLKQKELTEYKQSSQRELLAIKGKQSTELSQLNQKLKDRKVAFEALAKRQKESREEMDRLNNLLASEKSALSKLRKERDMLGDSLAKSREQLAMVKEEYFDLERKFEFAIAPVTSENPSPALRPTAAGAVPAESEPKKAKTPKASFDFDTIAID